MPSASKRSADMDWVSFVLGALVPLLGCVVFYALWREAQQQARGWMDEGDRLGRLLQHHGITQKGGRR